MNGGGQEMSRFKKALPVALLPSALLLCAGPARAQGTYTAADCSRDSVNAVINGPTHTAVDGDTINIPAGTCTWTSGITVPSGIGITILGAGTSDPYNPSGSGSTTTIIDNAAGGSSLFEFRPSYGASPSRVSSMYLSPQSGLSANSLGAPLAFQGTCTASGCPSIRVDHLVFPASPSWGGLTQPSSTMVVTDNVFGVMDHNSGYLDDPSAYYEFVNFNHSAWQGVGQYGDNSWASANTFGSNQVLYVETNYFELRRGNLFPITEAEGGFGITAEGGGRVACRFNRGVGLRSMCANHGTESNGRPRGGRQMEFYKNSMSCPSSSYPACWNNGMLSGAGVRSGSLLSIANSFTGGGINSFASISEYRAQQNISSPWGACDGTGAYDNNDGTLYASGTFTSVSGGWTVTDSTKSWTADQWVSNGSPYSVHDLTTGEGSEIRASGTNTLSGDPWTSVDFHAGDRYEIRRATACIDQTSRIGGSLLSGNPPTPTNSSQGWVPQTLDPAYEAADTASGDPIFGAMGADTERIIANRDYYAEVSQSAQTSPTSPFNGTVGTGYGTLANRPPTCTPGVAYWATDQGSWNQSGSGGQGALYICGANGWPATPSYTPYRYPHPLVSGDSIGGSPPAPPTSLTATVQ
jgi:hypothetical protein